MGWKDNISKWQEEEVEFCQNYVEQFGDHITEDGGRIRLIAKLANLLDARDEKKEGTGWNPMKYVQFGPISGLDFSSVPTTTKDEKVLAVQDAKG